MTFHVVYCTPIKAFGQLYPTVRDLTGSRGRAISYDCVASALPSGVSKYDVDNSHA